MANRKDTAVADGSTRQRILDASRELFNAKGYASTTLAEIAASVGIAEGNLWYHFRTKLDLVAALEEELRRDVRDRRAAYPSGGPAADDYVEGMLFAMNQKWAYRFLLRDHLQFSRDRKPLQLDPDMVADFDMLQEALRRMHKEGMFRRDVPVDIDRLSRALWMVSRYWTDHLQEHEGRDDISGEDQQRGFELHLTILLPYLTAASRRDLEAALLRVTGELAARAAT